MGIDRARVEAAHAKFREIADCGDWSGFADLFAEDGTFVNSLLPEPIRGREALRSFASHWPVVVNRAEWIVIDGNRLAVGWNERPRRPPTAASPRSSSTTTAW